MGKINKTEPFSLNTSKQFVEILEEYFVSILKFYNITIFKINLWTFLFWVDFSVSLVLPESDWIS